ncbi:MAG: PH domain-containing protein [Clostridiales bacterium]|jgi:uncharacterized membrane protein YdbT with pleckstrin-like domain|nr:PH domain-containing protein [Clostridiales bacterium]
MQIWKDRKRILGMPISFTVYSLSEDRLFVKTGLFNLRTEEILLYRIRDIGTRRTLGQRLFGVGSVQVCSSDHTRPELEVKNIRGAERVKELIHEHVEAMKLQRRMKVTEFLGDDDDHPDLFDGEDNR